MIPTSIDGTDITGATIDGTEVQEITVDGQTVFTPGPPLVDDFESGNLNAYTNTSKFSITSSVAAQGSNSLEMGGFSYDGIEMFSEPGDGLANYPQKGQKFSVLVRSDQSTQPAMSFGVDGSAGDGYLVQHDVPNNLYRLIKFDGNSFVSVLSTSNVTLNFNEFYEYEVQWHDGTGSESDNTIEITLFDIDSSLNRTSQLANDTATDSDYATNKGIAFGDFSSGSTGTAFFDNIVILGDVD